MDHQHLNQMYLGLQYSDQALMVSKNFAYDATNGKDYGLGIIFKTLSHIERLNSINNGITIKEWNPTLTTNLGQLALTINETISITTEKQKIKQFLSSKYPQLQNEPNTLWYLYLGRFAKEKGIDMLPAALEAILKCNGNFNIFKFEPSLNCLEIFYNKI